MRSVRILPPRRPSSSMSVQAIPITGTPVSNQRVRSGETGDAAADDDHVWSRPGVPAVVAGRAING